MKKKITILLIALVCAVLFLPSCKKHDNELESIVLYNPFEPNNGVELLQIDSVLKFPGTVNYVQCFFHVNYQYFSDTSTINRVMVHVNGSARGLLSAGQQSVFFDQYLQPGGTYAYQLSLTLDDGSVTKLTTPYYIVF